MTLDTELTTEQTKRANTARALKMTYPPKWVCGNPPVITLLGIVTLPVDWHIDQAERLIKASYPKANAYEAFDEQGEFVVYSNDI